MVAEPANPGPGQQTTLTITASGTHGVDKYGIKDVKVTLQVSKSPNDEAKIDPGSATTDASGTIIARFTPSKTKGLNAITITAGSLTTQFNIDTLVGSSGALVRGRHSGNLDPSPITGPSFNPLLIFVIAAAALLLGFVVPYRDRLGGLWLGLTGLRARRRLKQSPYVDPSQTEGWGPSSRKKSRARP